MCTGPHPFIPVLNVVQVNMRYQHDGENVENVFHVQVQEPVTVGNINEILDIFEAWNANSNLPLQSNQTRLTSIRAFDLTTEAGAVVDREITVNNTGNPTNFPEPGNVTLAVKKSSNVRGRGSQGRFFWIGLPEAAVEGNRVTAAINGGIIAAANALLEALIQATYPMVVVSYCENNAWRVAGVATPVTGFSTDMRIDSQRRRLAGRGR